MRRRSGVCAALALVLAPALLLLRPADGARPSAAAAPLHSQIVVLTVDGLRRDYRLFVPPGAPHSRPLLLALHQLHGSAAQWERRSRLDAGAAAADVVVAYPDGLGHSWDAGTCCQPAAGRHIDDVAFLRAVVRDAARRTPVDLRRVAVTGFSNGGLMSYRMVCQAADVVGAAVAVAGDLLEPSCRPSRVVSLLHVHGGSDRVIPLTGIPRSPIDPNGFPAARASVQIVATADGCTGSTDRAAGLLADWQATGCPAGVRVRLVTSAPLPHTYPVGATAYGIDMGSLTWDFLRSVWASA